MENDNKMNVCRVCFSDKDLTNLFTEKSDNLSINFLAFVKVQNIYLNYVLVCIYFVYVKFPDTPKRRSFSAYLPPMCQIPHHLSRFYQQMFRESPKIERTKLQMP